MLLFNDILIVASRVPFAADKLKFEEQLEMVASAGRFRRRCAANAVGRALAVRPNAARQCCGAFPHEMGTALLRPALDAKAAPDVQ